MRQRRITWLLGAGLLTLAGAVLAAEPQGLPGANPHPIHLVRPHVAPLSAMAQLGREIFYDARLSSSGRMSCASCHSPQHHYGPPNDGPVMLGGPDRSRQGARAVPSLAYLERQPNFSIGPDNEEAENVSLAQMAALGQQAANTPALLAGAAWIASAAFMGYLALLQLGYANVSPELGSLALWNGLTAAITLYFGARLLVRPAGVLTGSVIWGVLTVAWNGYQIAQGATHEAYLGATVTAGMATVLSFVARSQMRS